MVDTKKLLGGGDGEVNRLIELSSLIGVDLIECVWSQRRDSVAQMIGFKTPVVNTEDNFAGDIEASAWIDNTVKFFPDSSGVCWGYIFDIPENRKLIYTTMSNGYFRINDKKLREVIVEEAKVDAAKNGYEIDVLKVKDVVVRVSKREKDAEQRAKDIEKQLKETEKLAEDLKRQLSAASEQRDKNNARRLKGVEPPTLPTDEPPQE